MAEQHLSLAFVYQGWESYQQHLVTAIAALSPDQLALRASPQLRPVGQQVAHMIATRARWFFLDLREGGAELEALTTWDGWNAQTGWGGPAPAERTLHCSHSEQGRQLCMLAPYTTRRLPLASLRCSWTTNVCSAGQLPLNITNRQKAKILMDKQTNYIQVIHDIYPDLKIEAAHLNQNGQFNDILVINEEIIFRFPKTLREADRLVTESALLWNLQGRTTLPVPDPIYRSKMTEPIGHVFMGYHMLPGKPLWPETLHAIKDEKLIQHLADQLATFLRGLHSIPAEALEVKLPDFRGCDEWRELYERFRTKLFPFMKIDARACTARHFEDFLNDERNCDYAPALIHGDFGPSNILYDAGTKSISGIIDFSSAGWGDPATDFAAIICSVGYGEQFLDRFSAIYPGIENVLSRARFYAGTFALQEALYGLEDDDEVAFARGIEQYS